MGFWVLLQFVNGKFHTDSEITILKSVIDELQLDKSELQEQVDSLTSSLMSSNQHAATIIELWKELRQERLDAESRK